MKLLSLGILTGFLAFAVTPASAATLLVETHPGYSSYYSVPSPSLLPYAVSVSPYSTPTPASTYLGVVQNAYNPNLYSPYSFQSSLYGYGSSYDPYQSSYTQYPSQSPSSSYTSYPSYPSYTQYPYTSTPSYYQSPYSTIPTYSNGTNPITNIYNYSNPSYPSATYSPTSVQPYSYYTPTSFPTPSTPTITQNAGQNYLYYVNSVPTSSGYTYYVSYYGGASTTLQGKYTTTTAPWPQGVQVNTTGTPGVNYFFINK